MKTLLGGGRQLGSLTRKDVSVIVDLNSMLRRNSMGMSQYW